MDKKDFADIYNSFSQDVMNVAFFYTRNKDDAQDVTMDVFYHLMKKNPNVKDIKSYLLKETMRKSIDFYRRNKRDRYVHVEEEYFVSNDSYQEEIDTNLVRSLPKKYLSVITLFYVEELKISEIAKLLNISDSAVKKRLQRGRDMLEEKLKHE